MADTVEETWISDQDSFFAHTPRAGYTTRVTRCGISLGDPYDNKHTLTLAAEGKPRCSSCVDNVGVYIGV